VPIEVKNKQLSEIIAKSHPKTRRFVKDFLPPDPIAHQQSGKARMLSLNDAFHVCIGAHLVADMGYTTAQAKTILSGIGSWLKQAGLFPEKTPEYKPSKANGLVTSYIVEIRKTKLIGKPENAAGFSYRYKGTIFERVNKDFGLMEYGAVIFNKQYIEGPIIDHLKVGTLTDPLDVRILGISLLRDQFLAKIKKLYEPVDKESLAEASALG